MKRRHMMILTTALLLPLTACGLLTIQRTEFPDQLENADGQPIFVEDVLDIIQDPSLTADAQRSALQGLGITNQDFIDAIVDTGIDNTPPAMDDGMTDGDGTTDGGTGDGTAG